MSVSLNSPDQAILQSAVAVSEQGPQVRVLTLNELSSTFLRSWEELVDISVNPNPFLAPHFVLPAAKHIETQEPVLIGIEQGNQLIGLGVFADVARTRRMPLPHLRAWQSPHSYLDGMLLHKDHAVNAANAFWQYLKEGNEGWNGVEFPMLSQGDASSQILTKSATQEGVEFWTGQPTERATLNRSSQMSEQMMMSISTRRARSLRRGWNYLSKHGNVEFQIKRKPCELMECAEHLLQLESLGWKGVKGTALCSDPAQEQFFREMVSGFAKSQKLFFSELSVNGKPIAIVMHLLSGENAFAFKIGWNPQFERGCPGFQIKALIMNALGELTGVQSIDSCSCPGSFIEHLWPDRKVLAPYLFMTSRAGVLAGSVVGGLRWVRNRASDFLELGGAK